MHINNLFYILLVITCIPIRSPWGQGCFITVLRSIILLPNYPSFNHFYQILRYSESLYLILCSFINLSLTVLILNTSHSIFKIDAKSQFYAVTIIFTT